MNKVFCKCFKRMNKCTARAFFPQYEQKTAEFYEKLIDKRQKEKYNKITK